MPKGGTLFITTALDSKGKMVLLSIEDSGPGLPADQMEKVLRPFYSTKTGGTGLGLPLARQIMERFGGKLELKNGKKDCW